MKKYDEILQLSTEEEFLNAFEQLRNDDEFLALFSEVRDLLSVAYYFGDDFEAHEVENSLLTKTVACFDNPTFIIDGEVHEAVQYAYCADSKVPEGTVLVPINAYNEVMGTSYTSEEYKKQFPATITIIDYPHHSDDVSPVYQKTFEAQPLLSSGGSGFTLNPNDFKELYSLNLYSHAIYFDDPESAASVYMNMGHSDLYPNDESYKATYKIMDILAIFGEFFLLLYIGMLLICALVFVNFARRSIKRQMYQIGVLRALGCKNKIISNLFLYNLLIMGFFISLISLIVTGIAIPILNDVLLENMMPMLYVTPSNDFEVLRFNFFTATMDLITIMIISVLSSLQIFASCKKIKPINIIRSKE